MDAYGVTVENLANVIALENLNVAGGDIRSPQRKFTLRTRGDFENLSDIRNVVVSVKGGAPVYLYDLATIYEGPAERTELMRLNGKSGVVIRLSKQSDKNTVLVCRNIYKRLEELKGTLPQGFAVEPIFDQSEYIEQAISSLTDSAWQGSVLAIIIVFIFLRNIRSALILGLSIPLSIIATFIAMYVNGISLNMMSMGGLALGVGMLIDNSIVVLDNIFRYRERGARPTEAAKLGSEEMWLAITASTLTNIVVFVPFLFTEGLAKQLFKQMALTMTFSMLFSLLIALTLIPMMTARFVPVAEKIYRGRLSFLNRVFTWSKRRIDALDAYYSRVIEWALGHRKRVILYTVLAIVAGMVAIFLTGAEYMPEQDDARLAFQVKLPVGTNLETTEKTMIEIEKKISRIVEKKEYRVVSVRAGYGEGLAAAFSETTDNKSNMEFRLVSRTKRKRSLSEIRNALRDGLAGFPGVTFNFTPQSASSRMFSMGGGASVIINVYGYDFDESKRFTGEIYNAIRDIPGLKDIDISREEGLPEKVMEINREKASRAGLTSIAISTAIKNNVAGKVATVYRHKGKEYDVRLRLRPEDRKNLDDIKQIKVGTLPRHHGAGWQLHRGPGRGRSHHHRARAAGARYLYHLQARGAPPQRRGERHPGEARHNREAHELLRGDHGVLQGHAGDLPRPGAGPHPGSRPDLHHHGVAVRVAPLSVYRHVIDPDDDVRRGDIPFPHRHDLQRRCLYGNHHAGRHRGEQRHRARGLHQHTPRPGYAGSGGHHPGGAQPPAAHHDDDLHHHRRSDPHGHRNRRGR